MPTHAISTPVLFLIFNRPETTRRCFERIRDARPRSLYIVADGPRADRPDDRERCKATRAVVEHVDWPCEVHTDFRQVNLGLRRSVSSAIDWFFAHVEEGIILEDDCLAAPSFFGFAEELLTRYRDDERVMMISGSNLQFGRRRGSADYYFSRIAGIWGWATWRRAWSLFDRDMSGFPRFAAENQIRNVFDDRLSRRYWLAKLAGAHGGWNTWGFPWAFTLMTQSGLCACPNMNLVSNIGFGTGGVHATDAANPFASIPTGELGELVHPAFVLPDRDADAFLSRRAAELQLPEIFLTERVRRMVRRGLGRVKRELLGGPAGGTSPS